MEADSVDLISTLPDEILSHIISSLPFEYARQTIFLSTRWKLLWNASIVQHGNREDVASAVSGFLCTFDEHNPLKNTRKLQFYFGNGSVLLAIIAPGNRLHVDFSGGKQEFPRQFSLQLELNHGSLTCKPPSQSTFLVKTLHLVSVCSAANEAVSSMLSNFQFLEDLKIIACNGLWSLHIGSNTMLQTLTVFDCPQLKSVHIRSFKLKTFRYRGMLPWLWPEYHFNLADAMLDTRQGPGYSSFNIRDFDRVLLTIKNVKVLTLCKWVFEELICPSLFSLQTNFQFYNLKELWWIDNSKERCSSDALISFLKLCPSLERLFVTVDPKAYYMGITAPCSIQAVTNSKLEHLKVVRLEGFKNQEDEILVAGNIRDVATVKPLILSASDGNCLWRSVKVPLYQTKQERKSSSHEFEEEVSNSNGLCPKHVHMSL